MLKENLDPFRALVGVVEKSRDSDLLIRLMNTAGIRFELSLSDPQNISHKTRIRAFLPRIFNAYDSLDDQSKLSAAQALLAGLRQENEAVYTQASETLQIIGWEVRDGELLAITPDLREMFFPKGSPWDAFVVLRAVFAEAQAELLIVDGYCDSTVFQLLSQGILTSFNIKILCSRYAKRLATEGKAFMAQYPGVLIEVRETRDFHDRFIVVDGKSCIHVGASIKDAGKTAFMISRVEDRENLNALLQAIQTTWNTSTVVS
jgi:hypothetical protein